MISINICRISSDRTKLEFNVETLSNYKFIHLYVWEYNESGIWVVTPSTMDLSSYLDKVNNKEIKSISLSDIPLDSGSCYYLQFQVEWNNTGTESSTSTISNVVVADLSQNYFTKVKLFNELSKNSLNTDKLLEIMLYENAFKSSVTLERWEDVKYFYDLIVKFTNDNTVSSL